MRKIGKWVLVVITILCCLGFAAYLVFSQQMADHTPPKITAKSEVLEVSVGVTEEELLKGVVAWDLQDGDVTDSIVVEGISNISEDGSATVTYAAFDRSGNVVKAQRTLRYTDYSSPRFSLSAPLVFRSGAAYDVLRCVGAEDVVDGELDSRIKATLVSGEASVTSVGSYEVEFRVTNSMGDTVYLTLPVEVYASSAYNATVELSSYLVYVKQGARFNSDIYLKTLRMGSREVDLSNGLLDVTVDTDSNVDTSVPGTYSVAYTVKSGTYTGYTKLIVIVEE